MLRAIGPVAARSRPPARIRTSSSTTPVASWWRRTTTGRRRRTSREMSRLPDIAPSTISSQPCWLNNVSPGRLHRDRQRREWRDGRRPRRGLRFEPVTHTRKLANIATRGLVRTGDNVMIGGFYRRRAECAESARPRRSAPRSLIGNKLADPRAATLSTAMARS
jgi:hypothetical protein